jgi:general secretion pathway protein I
MAARRHPAAASISPAERGFTLLEVLVAIAILGLGLTVILSSQVGLFSGASRGQHLSMATNLLRCKMSEVEEDLLRTGYPLVDHSEEGDCCEGDTSGAGDGYRCAWKIERVELPTPTEIELADGGAPTDSLGALGKLAEIEQTQGASLGDKPDLGSIAETLGGGASAAGLAPLVMSLVYPQLKPMLEASIRKVTVTVSWREGKSERTLDVVQYLTDPRQGEIDPNAPTSAPDGGALFPGLTGLSP